MVGEINEQINILSYLRFFFLSKHKIFDFEQQVNKHQLIYVF